MRENKGEWDVFLNFRGEDTRHGFMSRLYDGLKSKGVRVFMDDDALNQGDEIATRLLDAIRDSATSIAIISPRYASSRWCLEELATICDCGRLILPVFYQVDPSDVRRQKGPFEACFESLEKRFGVKQVARWRAAMEKAGGKKGWVFQNSGEPQLIQLLVRRILDELSKIPMGVASYIVGLNFRIEELMRLLDAKSNGIRVLGLYGMGGVGKTTLAKALYNKLVRHFEHHSFISNVREAFKQQNGIVSLQKEFLRDLSQGNTSSINDVKAGKAAIKETLSEKRVFVVLDDVDDASQLGELAARREWFYEGSRVIITTRDRDVLLACNVNEIYEVKELGSSESLELFLYHALRSKKPTEIFLNHSRQIVSLTGGLPLALEVFGSFLFDKRRVEEWEDALQKLKRIRPGHLHEVLKISFNGLDEEEKCVFLDIACLFVNLRMKRDYAIDVLKGCDFKAEISINVLIARSLIRITEDGYLWMHDQIRDMGQQIVLLENTDFGMRSRLWDRGEILTVLRNRTGTRGVEGIVLDFEKKELSAKSISWGQFRRTPSVTSAITYLIETYKEYFHHAAKKEEEVILQTEPFQSMVRLRLLRLSNVRLVGSFKCLPHELKWLQWRSCPLDSLPPNFCPQQLTVLDVSESKIKIYGEGDGDFGMVPSILRGNIQRAMGKLEHFKGGVVLVSDMVAENLMVIDLHNCYNLTAIPDLSRHPALEKLILERCTSLTTIHKSLEDSTKLRHLNVKECSNLEEFPDHISGLTNLETLNLSGCFKLKRLPQKLCGLKSLRELYIDETAIEKLPDSIFWLTKLEVLSLNNCQSLKQLPFYIGQLVSLRTLSMNGSALEELPDSISLLKNLETLSLIRCKSLTVLPNSVGNLKSLSKFWLYNSSVKELPASIGSLSYLMHLSVGNCLLDKLPVSIGELASVIELQLYDTLIITLPDQVNGLKSLEKLEMRNCKLLESLPESFGHILTLTRLTIVNAAITELPESIGMLENLVMLSLNKCKRLSRLPSSIGKLKSLHHLHMEETAVTKLPETFGMLSNLMTLEMAKKPYDEVSQAQDAENSEPIVLPDSFSNLSLLEKFDARAWKIVGKLADDFEKLVSLEILNLSHNDFHSFSLSLRGLSVLKKLLLQHCENLKALPLLPSSLVELNAANCTSLESIYDLSNLVNLGELNLANCGKLKGVPGLECLKSMRMLHMSGCISCSSEAMAKLDKIAFRKLRVLSLPGKEIPEWFTPEVACYSKPRNLAIRAVIIGVIVSINHQIPDKIRDQLPVVYGIQAKILRSNEPIFTTAPYLAGVPRTDEDHFFLCRYVYPHPLVSLLKDGDNIKVVKRDPPIVQGVQLKKWGVHLVFENDDDYVGDEKSLTETQQSVSQKLTTFIGSV